MLFLLSFFVANFFTGVVYSDNRVCNTASGTQLEAIPETTVSDWSTSRLSNTASCGYVIDDILSDGRVLALGSCSSQFDYRNSRRISYRYDCDSNDNLRLRIWTNINAKRFCRNAEFNAAGDDDFAIYDEIVLGLDYSCGDTCSSLWSVIQYDSCNNLIQTSRIEYGLAIEACYSDGTNSFIRTCGVDSRSFTKATTCNMDEDDTCNRANALFKFSSNDCSGTPTDVEENLVQQYQAQLCCSGLEIDGLEVLNGVTYTDNVATEARCRWDTREFTKAVFPNPSSFYQTRANDLIIFLSNFNNYVANNNFINAVDDFCLERDCNLGSDYVNELDNITSVSFIPNTFELIENNNEFPDISTNDFWPDLQYERGFFRVTGNLTSTSEDGCSFEGTSTFLIFFGEEPTSGATEIERVYQGSFDVTDANDYFENANLGTSCSPAATTLETANINFASCINTAYGLYTSCISGVTGLQDALDLGVTSLEASVGSDEFDDYLDCVDDFIDRFEDCVEDRQDDL